jgi:AraC family transcriptional activator of mtrCDE
MQTGLDNLIDGLDVRFVGLAECLVSEGHRLHIDSSPAVGIHYGLLGCGTMTVSDGAVIELAPHTLVVVPPNHSFELTVSSDKEARNRTAEARKQTMTRDGIRRYAAGDGEPQLIVICGFFSASYSENTELFAGLCAPIAERFSVEDQLDARLKQALAELIAEELGSGAMMATLLKQVIVTLIRRSLKSPSVWTERFAMLSDARIARAFSEMVAHPGLDHTVQSLAKAAYLSRSGFMTRFAAVTGRSPMIVLRELRMRRAAEMLERSAMSVGEIAHKVGYASPSSFARAFRQAYGNDPTDYRARHRSKNQAAI